MGGEQREQLVAALVQQTRAMARQMVRFYDAVADQLGLHITDLTCLGALRDRRRATAGELATELGLTTGAVTRMIDRLDRGGFVRRVRDPNDGRRVIVELIPEAEGSVVGLFAGQAARITESADGLTDAQLRLLLGYVQERTEVSRTEADRLRREGKPHATRGARDTRDTQETTRDTRETRDAPDARGARLGAAGPAGGHRTPP